MSLRNKNCNIHTSEKAIYYCLDHSCNKKGPICEKCATQIHLEHESIFTIDDICNFIEDQVDDNIQCPEKEDQHFEQLNQSICEKLDSIYAHIDQFEKYVITKMNFLKQKIRKEKKNLQDKLEDIFEFRELFKKNNQDLIVNVLQGIDITSLQSSVKVKRKNIIECTKFLNSNNQKLHIKDFRVSEPSFLKSLILKKFTIQMQKINNHCQVLLERMLEETSCQFSQKNQFQFKKLPNKYQEDKFFSEKNGFDLFKKDKFQKSKSVEKDCMSSSSCTQSDSRINNNSLPSLTDILKQIEQSNGDEYSAFSSFQVDQRFVGDKIEISNQDKNLEQKGFVQRFAFLFPQFKDIDENKKIYHVKIRILNYKTWIAFGIGNREAISKQNLKYIEGLQAYLISLNGYVYNSREEPVKELENLNLEQGDIISLIFYYDSPCKSQQCLEIWLNNQKMLKTFKGNLFEKNELNNIAFCIGLLKGDSVEIIKD
ncbi:hypothetical protein TTHERM_00933360 (macronuclear) [Tetrahymena thermophila SB210]|uniref:B box-type domain-containing protein n=1 Tax=Tetrahymena thermophila (strain SB210) TaxID=312017 RepID=I7M9G9_TETTS|nr:hypothetical protein TTHERM_00933360 [Tetrahymena thermophila SB210]EAS01647.1 hypothetical protein TTHERM_00933360 [Tetrahymena thermophila SB210]|eukprot:XP_001021892.1 hypothetical protein TTHERM_00933360 [Tetrahymena thermophila SB210]